MVAEGFRKCLFQTPSGLVLLGVSAGSILRLLQKTASAKGTLSVGGGTSRAMHLGHHDYPTFQKANARLMHKTICWSPPATNHFSKLFFHHHIKLCAALPAAMNNRGLLPITPSIIEAKAVGICLNEERSSAESFSIPLAVSKRRPYVGSTSVTRAISHAVLPASLALLLGIAQGKASLCILTKKDPGMPSGMHQFSQGCDCYGCL